MSEAPVATVDDSALATCPLALDALRFWSLITRLRLCLEYRKRAEAIGAVRQIEAELLNPTLPEPFSTRLLDRWPGLKADFDRFVTETFW